MTWKPYSYSSLCCTNKSKSEEISGLLNTKRGLSPQPAVWQVLYLPIRFVGCQDDLEAFIQQLFVGCGNPFKWGLDAEQPCALEWVHSWSWAMAVFPPGQSRTSRQFLQTDFLIVLDNCTRGKGNAGDWEHFFPRKTLIQAHRLGINSSQDMEQSKDQD